MKNLLIVLCVLCVLTISECASSQVLLLSAGDSSLMQGAGAGVTAYFPNHTTTLSGGVEQGHLVFGASDTFDWKSYEWKVGTQTWGGLVDGASLGLQSIGLSAHRYSKDKKRAVGLFVGSTGNGYGTPWFTGNIPSHIGAAFFSSQQIGRFKFGTVDGISGGLKTALVSVSYTSYRLHGNAVAGLFQNQRYAAGYVDYAIIQALHVNLTQQDTYYFQPSIGQLHVTGTSAGISASSRFVFGSANANHSVADGIVTDGESFGAGVHVSLLTLQSNYYKSGRFAFKTYSASEMFWRHYTATETVTQSASGTSTSFGGGYVSNRFSVSLNHNVVFIPFEGKGYTQVTSVTASFRVRDAVINLANVLDPTGHMKYTVYGSDYAHGPMNTTGSDGHQFNNGGGKFVIMGVVKSSQTGNVVEGMAVRIGKQVVFSNSSGVIFTRVKHKEYVTLQVLPEDASTPGKWKVTDAPATVEEGQPFVITVEML